MRGTQIQVKQSPPPLPHSHIFTHTHIPTPCKHASSARHRGLLPPAHIPGGVRSKECGTARRCGGHGLMSRGVVEPILLLSLLCPPLPPPSTPSRAFSDWSVGGEQRLGREGGEGEGGERTSERAAAAAAAVGAQLAASVPELTASHGVRHTPHQRALPPRRDAHLLHADLRSQPANPPASPLLSSSCDVRSLSAL